MTGATTTGGADDDDGGDAAAGGCSGCVNPETDGGLARGVMAHVLELLR